MTRINPLHNPDTIIKQMEMTGEYPDAERRTGRSTAIALRIIAEAIANPYAVIHVRDHEDNKVNNIALTREINVMCFKLGLEHFVTNLPLCTVTFGRVRAPIIPTYKPAPKPFMSNLYPGQSINPRARQYA